RYWKEPVPNDSHIYNYYQWNRSHRPAASQYLKTDPRPLPRPIGEVELESQFVPICPSNGLIIFSAAQLHSTIPNTSGSTRFSIDFRTVHLDDLQGKRGAPNVDSASTGTSLRDFLRGSDLSPISEDVISLYSDGTEASGDLIYNPPS